MFPPSRHRPDESSADAMRSLAKDAVEDFPCVPVIATTRAGLCSRRRAVAVVTRTPLDRASWIHGEVGGTAGLTMSTSVCSKSSFR